MPTDFSFDSVAYGLLENEFMGADIQTRRKLLALMARISEASYRRGVQHALASGEYIYTTPSKFRYDLPLSVSPSLEGDCELSAVRRLLTNYPVLRDAGFYGLETPDDAYSRPGLLATRRVREKRSDDDYAARFARPNSMDDASSVLEAIQNFGQISHRDLSRTLRGKYTNEEVRRIAISLAASGRISIEVKTPTHGGRQSHLYTAVASAETPNVEKMGSAGLKAAFWQINDDMSLWEDGA